MDNFHKKLLPTDWLYVERQDNHYTINIFDDGNEIYNEYENKWILFGKWKGKIALFNKKNPEIIISSISAWKASCALTMEDFLEKNDH